MAEEAPDGAFAELQPTAGEAGGEAVLPEAPAPEVPAEPVVLEVLQEAAPPPVETAVAVEAPAAEAPAQPAEVAQPLELAATDNGERYEDGKWYYYEDGEKYTGWMRLSDGRLVYYNEDGSMQWGEKEMDDGLWYYFRDGDGAWQGGWQNLEGRDVYYDWEYGMHFGAWEVDDVDYFFDYYNGARTLGEVCLDPDDDRKFWRYYIEEGYHTGELNYDGRWLYYNPYDDLMMFGATLLADGRTVYYHSETGAMQFGEFNDPLTYKDFYDYEVTVPRWYYADPTNGQLAQGLTQLDDGRLVFYSTSGMALGQFGYNGSQYYASKLNGEINFEGGWIEENDGSVLYFADHFSGLVYGVQEIDDQIYFFANGDPYYGQDSFGTLQTGWQFVYEFYLNDGQLATWMLFGGDNGAFTGLSDVNDPGSTDLFDAQFERYVFNARYEGETRTVTLVENEGLSALATELVKEVATTKDPSVRPNGKGWDTLFTEYGFEGLQYTTSFTSASFATLDNTQTFETGAENEVSSQVYNPNYKDYGYGYYMKDDMRAYVFIFTDLAAYESSK